MKFTIIADALNADKFNEWIYYHRVRMLAGIVLFVVELLLYFGTGVMLEERVNFHSGEGSWEISQSPEAADFCQEFIPQYRHLSSLSFLMKMEEVTERDGEVRVLVLDESGTFIFDQTLRFDQIASGSFTDVTVDLKLSPGKPYYLQIVTEPSSAGEYPAVGVCGREYYLPENQRLMHGEEMPDIQLLSRYRYGDIMPISKAIYIILISALTACGVMFGLPDNKRLSKAVGIALLAVVPWVLGSRLEMLTCNEALYLPISLKWNVGIMYALEILVLLCTHSPGIAMALTNTLLTLLYSANYFVLMYRGTSLRVSDFTVVGTVIKVVGDYSFVPNDHLAFTWGLLVLFVVYGVQTGAWKAGGKLRAVTAAIAAAVAVYGGYQLFCTDFLEHMGFWNEELAGINYELIYTVDGYLVGTCIQVKNSRITPPEGYSVDRAEAVLRTVLAQEADRPSLSLEEQPHVILIMNESFSDLRILGDLELNQENLVFFNSLTDNTVRGYVNASVIGGGTANSEFEVFTGCTTAFFPINYYPYQQGIRRPVNSLVSSMREQGYTAISMHPAPANNWNRGTVYKCFGFDKTLWTEDFTGAETIHHGVSDAETYRKVIELYENREEGEKLFLFDLTMQNHGGYPGKNVPYEVQSGKMQDVTIDEYLTLMKISDEAFADLVSYFEKQDEKVIICMFGDHQPWFSDLIVEACTTDESQSSDQLMNKYKTPFIIWANFDIEEEDGYDISMNYLGGLLLRTAEIPQSPYFHFLEQLQAKYPIITVNGYVDSEGLYHTWESEPAEFSEYRVLQYNYLFDIDTVKWGY